MSWATYDGGVMEIVPAEEEKPVNFTVNVIGNVKRIGGITIGKPGSGTAQTVVEGTNNYSCMASTDYVIITTANGGEAFYKVDKNSQVKNATWNGEGDDGYWGYTYGTNTISAGDVITINTDGDSSVKYNFSIVNADGSTTYDYLTSLTTLHYENGVEVVEDKLTDFTGSFEVPDGYKVKFTANVKDYYYADGAWTISQDMGGTVKTLPFNSGSYNQTIKGNTTVTILAQKIVRDKWFSLSYDTDHYTCAVMYNGTGTKLLDANVTSGMHVDYGDADFPIMLWLTCTDSSATTSIPVLSINGETKDYDTLQFYLEKSDYAGTDNHHIALPDWATVDIAYVSPNMTINVNEAAGLTVTNVETVESLVNGTNTISIRDDSNADDKKIHFVPKTGYIITSILKNGTEVINFKDDMTLDQAKALRYDGSPAAFDVYDVTVRDIAYNVSYNNGKTGWDTVYAIVDNNKGKAMTAPGGGDGMGSSVWTYNFESVNTPQTIKFSDGADKESEEFTFENGKEYGEALQIFVYAPKYGNGDSATTAFCTDATEAADLDLETVPEDGVISWIIPEWNAENGICVMKQNIIDLSGAPEFFGGVALENKTWKQLYGYSDPESAAMKLPAEAAGQKVEFKYNVDTNEFFFSLQGKLYSVSYNNGMSQWDEVYAYVWKGDGEDAEYVAELPGVKMTAPGEEGDTMGATTVWTYEFRSTFEPESIIFSNGNGAQTEDLEFVNGKEYGEAYKLYAYIPMDGDGMASKAPFLANAELASQMGFETFEDGIFTWTVESWNSEHSVSITAMNVADMTNFEYTYFGNPDLALVNNAWNQFVECETPEAAATYLPADAAGQKVEFKYNVNTNELFFSLQGKLYSVSYNNGMSQWDEVYACVWKGDGEDAEYVAEWPGVKMTAPGEEGDSMGATTIWTYEFRSTFEPESIIFSNGNGAQTSNLVFENGKEYGEAYKAYVFAAVKKNYDYMTEEPFSNDPTFVEDYGYNAIVDGKMNWTVASWDKDEEFCIMKQNIASLSAAPEFFGNAELKNNETTPLSSEAFSKPEGAYMTLPANAVGQEVTFSYDINNNTLWVSYVGKKYAVTFCNNIYQLETPHVYAWAGDTHNVWPGVAMTLNDNGFYTAEIDFEPESVIFNNAKGDDNGKVQTGTLAYSEDKTYGVDLYLVGAQNEWAVADANLKFENENNAVYTFTLADAWSGKWKLVTDDWAGNRGLSQEAPANTKTVAVAGFGEDFDYAMPAGAKLIFNVADNTLRIIAPIYIYGEYVTTSGIGAEYTCTEHTWSSIDDAIEVNPDEDGNYAVDFQLRYDQEAKFIIATSKATPFANYIGVQSFFAASTADYKFAYYNAESEADVNPIVISTTVSKDSDVSLSLNTTDKKLTLAVEDVATGINSIYNDGDANAEYYTIQGVKVQNPTEGLYIRVANGKATKVIVK